MSVKKKNVWAKISRSLCAQLGSGILLLHLETGQYRGRSQRKSSSIYTVKMSFSLYLIVWLLINERKCERSKLKEHMFDVFGLTRMCWVFTRQPEVKYWMFQKRYKKCFRYGRVNMILEEFCKSTVPKAKKKTKNAIIEGCTSAVGVQLWEDASTNLKSVICYWSSKRLVYKKFLQGLQLRLFNI